MWNRAVARDAEATLADEERRLRDAETQKRALLAALRHQVKEQRHSRRAQRASDEAFERALISNDHRNVRELVAHHEERRRVEREYAEHCHLVSLAVLAKRQEERDEERQAGNYKLWAHRSKEARDEQLAALRTSRARDLAEVSGGMRTSRDHHQRAVDKAREWQLERPEAESMARVLAEQEERRQAEVRRLEQRREIRYRRAVATAVSQSAREEVSRSRDRSGDERKLVGGDREDSSGTLFGTPALPLAMDVAEARARQVAQWSARREELDASIQQKRDQQAALSAARDAARNDSERALEDFRAMERERAARRAEAQHRYEAELLAQMTAKELRDGADFGDAAVNPFRRPRGKRSA